MKRIIKSRGVLVVTTTTAVMAGVSVVASPEIAALLRSVLTSILGG